MSEKSSEFNIDKSRIDFLNSQVGYLIDTLQQTYSELDQTDTITQKYQSLYKDLVKLNNLILANKNLDEAEKELAALEERMRYFVNYTNKNLQ